jgi:hypothetical protein
MLYAKPDEIGGVLYQNQVGRVIALGTTVPADADAGFAPGCIFIHTDGGAGTALYVNEGTVTSADFNPIAATGAGSFSSITSSGNLTFSAASDIVVPANTAVALEVYDATTKVYALDTRNTIADVSAHTFRAAATTIATAAAAHLNPVVHIPARTITYTGTNTVTSQLGGMLNVGVLTLTDASAGTVSLASAMHIHAVAAAGGSLTLTAARMISTSVSDCYLTNAGVWTDTACWSYAKENILPAAKEAVLNVVDRLNPRSWFYTKGPQGEKFHGDDFGRERVGIVYDELPDELRAPGEQKAVSPGILASFCLAAIKVLRDENRELKDRLAAAGL